MAYVRIHLDDSRNQARVNGGSNYDSLSRAEGVKVTKKYGLKSIDNNPYFEVGIIIAATIVLCTIVAATIVLCTIVTAKI